MEQKLIDPDLPEGMVPEISPMEVLEMRRWAEGYGDGRNDERRQWNKRLEGPMPSLVERKYLIRAFLGAGIGWLIAIPFLVYHVGNWLAGEL